MRNEASRGRVLTSSRVSQLRAALEREAGDLSDEGAIAIANSLSHAGTQLEEMIRNRMRDDAANPQAIRDLIQAFPGAAAIRERAEPRPDERPGEHPGNANREQSPQPEKATRRRRQLPRQEQQQPREEQQQPTPEPQPEDLPRLPQVKVILSVNSDAAAMIILARMWLVSVREAQLVIQPQNSRPETPLTHERIVPIIEHFFNKFLGGLNRRLAAIHAAVAEYNSTASAASGVTNAQLPPLIREFDKNLHLWINKPGVVLQSIQRNIGLLGMHQAYTRMVALLQDPQPPANLSQLQRVA